jgi:hypothetical protein
LGAGCRRFKSGRPDQDNFAELYDPAAGTFTATGSLAGTWNMPTATLLENGMVLITGGASGVPSSDVNLAAELYDPIRGTFTATGSMSVERTWDTATLLGNGKVLIVDGQDPEVTTTKHLSMTTVPGLAQARTGWQVPRVW